MKESYVERWEREQKEKAAKVAEEKVEVTEEVTENEQNAGCEGQAAKKESRSRKQTVRQKSDNKR